MSGSLTPEEQVIRDWLDGQLSESGSPLPPSKRRSQSLPRRQVTAVVATLIELLDEARAAPPVMATGFVQADAALAAVSSGEPFHESRYREHDDEGNHIWDHPVSPAPVPAAGLPPPDPSLIGTEYHPISIDGGRYRPPITEEIRLLRQRFPEVVAAIEAAAVRERDELREAHPNMWSRAELLDIFDRTADKPEIRAKITRILALHSKDGAS